MKTMTEVLVIRTLQGGTVDAVLDDNTISAARVAIDRMNEANGKTDQYLICYEETTTHTDDNGWMESQDILITPVEAYPAD